MAYKEFVFLYPIPQILDFELDKHSLRQPADPADFKNKYIQLLNLCIQQRYRDRGFRINFVVFQDCQVSPFVQVQPADRVIQINLDFATHRLQAVYPDPDEILAVLGKTKIIRIAGFHLWDCVEKIARRAHQKRLNTLVDEDLTELFGHAIRRSDFETANYPTFNPRQAGEDFYTVFMQARENKPWMWQEY